VQKPERRLAEELVGEFWLADKRLEGLARPFRLARAGVDVLVEAVRRKAEPARSRLFVG